MAVEDRSGTKMSGQLAGHVERLLGRRVLRSRSVPRGGWSIARRGVFELDGGETVFAKMGDVPDTIAAIRAECEVYPRLTGPFVPRCLAADPEQAVLVLEDLSASTWPPPWTPDLLAALEYLFIELAATAADPSLPTLADRLREWGAWELVTTEPSALLASGLVSAAWLDQCLQPLLDAQSRGLTEGDSLLHMDVRSDNLCFRGGSAMLVDWNHAARGDSRWDRLLMLPTIELEGGPPAQAQAPEADPAIVVWLAGYFAAHVGLPAPEGAPGVRRFQRAQLNVVLPWACRLLDIPAPAR
jgi:hypothetical protein